MIPDQQKPSTGPELAEEARYAAGDNGGCPPDCGHSPEEHGAFDAGVIEGRRFGYDADNPYESGPADLWDAWETGRSVGACDTGRQPHNA